MFQIQNKLVLGRRPFLFKSSMKMSMLKGKTIDAHIAKCGTFSGYRDGEFSLTRKMFDQMIGNFQSEKNPLPVYFGHSDTIPLAEEPEAKGWILAVERRGDDLWAKLEMTSEMESKIKDGKFRFTSIFCRTQNVHRETGKKIGARLVSLAITNSPFIDGLEALTLSQGHNTTKVDTYATKDIFKMIDHKNKAEKILSTLELDATEERLSALEAALQAMEPEVKSEEEDAPEDAPEDAAEEADAPEVDLAKMEELRAMAAELLGQPDLDMAGFMDHMQSMLEQMASADPEAEAMAAAANERSANGPDAVGVVASNHPAFIALKSELGETQKLVNELQAQKQARDEADIESVVLSAIEDGKILDTSKDHWIKAMKMDKELALSLMEGSEAVTKGRIAKADSRDSKKLSKNVIALTEHERKILAGAGIKK